MSVLATTTMSSRGQVVIPEAVRDEMGLKAGAKFVVVSHGDAVMLKKVAPLSAAEFAVLHRRLRQQARAAGLTRKDIAKAITKVRRRP
jgi:AbrB family looped-hinge helix DNA binding protein